MKAIVCIVILFNSICASRTRPVGSQKEQQQIAYKSGRSSSSSQSLDSRWMTIGDGDAGKSSQPILIAKKPKSRNNNKNRNNQFDNFITEPSISLEQTSLVYHEEADGGISPPSHSPTFDVDDASGGMFLSRNQPAGLRMFKYYHEPDLNLRHSTH